MSRLVSGMILIEKEYGDLHYLITTPSGYRVIDVDGCCEEFIPERYKKAYIPQDYSDPWVPIETTEVNFE